MLPSSKAVTKDAKSRASGRHPAASFKSPRHLDRCVDGAWCITVIHDGFTLTDDARDPLPSTGFDMVERIMNPEDSSRFEISSAARAARYARHRIGACLPD
jgi:hypothetical protein